MALVPLIDFPDIRWRVGADFSQPKCDQCTNGRGLGWTSLANFSRGFDTRDCNVSNLTKTLGQKAHKIDDWSMCLPPAKCNLRPNEGVVLSETSSRH